MSFKNVNSFNYTTPTFTVAEILAIDNALALDRTGWR